VTGPPPNLTQQWVTQNFPNLTNLAPLSRGGQKLVISAQHPTHGSVVLKLILPTQDAESLKREILAVRQINSPRVPKILEDGSVPSQFGVCYWLLEQTIPGESVRSVVQRGPMAASEVLRLGLHVLQAVVLAEASSIVHRDIKPDNIMRDPTGAFWLLDFGVSRHLTLDSLTATALPFGKVTWGYSPLEQCRNLKPAIDSRSDLFALGVTLFECATGNNPFRTGAQDALHMLHRIENQALPALMLPIQSQEDFRDLIGAMTQKRRDHRPETAAEALQWIGEICGREGIQ